MRPGAKRWPLQRPWPGPAAAQRRRRTQRPPDRSEAKGGMPHRGCPNDSEDWGWTGLWLKAIASSEAVAGSGRAKRRRRTQRPPDRSEAKGGMPHRGCPNDSEDRGWTAATFAYENTPSSDDDRVSYEKVAATYSPTWWGSTIGDGELNFSVRNGKRWILTAITATVCF